MVSLWPLYLKRTVLISRRVQSSKAEVLATMHEIEKVVRNSPLYVEGSIKADTSAKAAPGFIWYTFKKRVPSVLGIIPSRDIDVRIMWGLFPDGTEAHVFAALGTHLVNRVTVTELPKHEWKSPDQEECTIVELINVEVCPIVSELGERTGNRR
jgi:hypothetical protein